MKSNEAIMLFCYRTRNDACNKVNSCLVNIKAVFHGKICSCLLSAGRFTCNTDLFLKRYFFFLITVVNKPSSLVNLFIFFARVSNFAFNNACMLKLQNTPCGASIFSITKLFVIRRTLLKFLYRAY